MTHSSALLRHRTAMRRHALVGALVAIGLVVGFGGWAATANISGAVIAPGTVVVVSEVKKIQHPTGGVIGSILVKEGERVEAGQLLVQLDGTVTRSNLAIVTRTLDELQARQARLRSERDGLDRIDLPATLLKRRADPELATIIDSETRLFDLRRTERDGNKARLGERIEQLREEAVGLTAQANAKGREVDLVARELESARDLWKKNLVELSRLTALEREAVRIDGEKAALASQIAQTRGRITETRLHILQIDREFNAEVARELRELDARVGELIERRVAAEDMLARIDLHAPVAGVVHQMAIHTIGGVVGPGEVMMLIVPADDALAIEARIQPSDIDQLRPGATTMVRLSAFNQRTTPELVATLASISADTTTEPRSGASFYKARVVIPDEEIARLGNLRLVPGMPAEIFVRTADRKALSLLAKPFTDQLYRAFRDD